jgi:glycyl-tRNA synthetase beta chain
LIIDGNQRVVRPRLADARFFFEQDKKTRLADRVPQLADPSSITPSWAPRRSGPNGFDTWRATLPHALGSAVEHADRAAMLAKTDLLTGMVGEFPELQGVMGTYYARHDGEADAVAQAITEQYQPRFAGDALPASETGTVLALADKLETLAGLFGIGQQPTGDKDPFALRRHALGVIRMLVEKQLELPLALSELLDIAFGAFDAQALQGRAGPRDLHLRAPGRLAARARLQPRRRSRRSSNSDLATLARVVEQLEAVRAFSALPQAASAGRRQQAHQQHPAQSRGDVAATEIDARPAGRRRRARTGRTARAADPESRRVHGRARLHRRPHGTWRSRARPSTSSSKK